MKKQLINFNHWITSITKRLKYKTHCHFYISSIELQIRQLLVPKLMRNIAHVKKILKQIKELHFELRGKERINTSQYFSTTFIN